MGSFKACLNYCKKTTLSPALPEGFMVYYEHLARSCRAFKCKFIKEHGEKTLCIVQNVEKKTEIRQGSAWAAEIP